MPVEIRAFIREGNHNKMSEHGFERHTPVLELGLRGATHALRILSSCQKDERSVSSSESRTKMPDGVVLEMPSSAGGT